jgi:hypothetical protein
VEWRHAAELFGMDTIAAVYCWHQWERIMQLPRRLAGPIIDSRAIRPNQTSAAPSGMALSNDILLATTT